VKVKMVTGDNVAIAQQIASELDMGTNIQPARELFPGDVTKGQIPLDAAEKIDQADGFAEVFPEHKYAIVKILQQNGHIVGMTGDGVNDAPALKQADVGIAVSEATEAARAPAALVLTAPGLSVIIDGIAEARRIFERMTSYVLYRIAMTIAIMVFVVLASIFYQFFPLTAIMLIALARLDDVPIMTIAFDNATVPPKPVRWELDRVLVISSMLGLLGVIQSFGFALSRRHSSSPAASAAANNDVPATRCWRSSHVVRDAHQRSVLETAISQLPIFLCDCRDTNRVGVHVQSGLACAATVLGNHRVCLGL
jgi:H+-transporting ATPase